MAAGDFNFLSYALQSVISHDSANFNELYSRVMNKCWNKWKLYRGL